MGIPGFPEALQVLRQDAGEQVTGTLAGRAFATGQPGTGSSEQGRQRVWVPVLEQTACTGVLALTVPEVTEQALAQAQLLGVFAGLITAVAVRVSDIPTCGAGDARCRFRRACNGTCCRR